MDREKLESLGISPEHIDSIISLYETASSGQSATSDELARAKAEIAERDSQIEAFKSFQGDSEALKTQVADLQKLNKEAGLKHKEEMELERKVYAIKQSLMNGDKKPYDVGIVLSQLDLSNVSLDDKGELKGLKEQHDLLYGSKPFLFAQAVEAQHKGVNVKGKREETKPVDDKPKADDGDFGKQMAMRNLKRL